MMQIARAAAARDRFIKDRAAFHLLDILAEVADGHLFWHGYFAFVRSLLAHHHAKQRRFPRAVRTHQSDLLARVQLERSINKNELLPVLFIDIRKINHSAPCRAAGITDSFMRSSCFTRNAMSPNGSPPLRAQ